MSGSGDCPRRGESFPRRIRLRRHGDYQRVQSEGTRIRLPHLLVLYSPGGACSRVGITVSRKVGGAVTRNRVKRWLRESVRRQYDRLGPGWDVVIVARRSAVEAGYHALQREVASAFERIRGK